MGSSSPSTKTGGNPSSPKILKPPALSNDTSASHKVVGFENMPCVNYNTVYPLTKRHFVSRFVQTFIKLPLTVALVAMLIQYTVLCRYEDGGSASSQLPAHTFSWSEYIWGIDQPATTFVEGPISVSVASPNTVIGIFTVESLQGFHPAFYFCLLASIARTLTALLVHPVYYLIEKKQWLQRYKIPRTSRTEPSDDLRWDSYKANLIEFIMSPIALWFTTHFGIIYKVEEVCQPIAIIPTCLFIAASLFFNETGFYWIHRLFHEVPFLYKHIHKKHHKFIGSVSIAAEYAHPFESIFSNSFPLIAFSMLYPVKPIVFAVWTVIRLMETFESHSGYCFDGCWLSEKLNMTFSGYAMFHDFHHVNNKGNYGQGGLFWDYICGTDSLFRSKLTASAERRTKEEAEKAGQKLE